MKNWETIYNSSNEIHIEIVRSILKEHGIESIAVNKKDSFYHFGTVEILVEHKNVLQSIKIIEDDIRFE